MPNFLAASLWDGEVSGHVPSLSSVRVHVWASRLELGTALVGEHVPLLIGILRGKLGPCRRGVLVATMRDAVELLDILVLGDVVRVAEVDGEDVTVWPDRVQKDGHRDGLVGDRGGRGRQ